MYVTSEKKRPKSRGDGRRAHVTAVSEEEQPVCDEKMHARRHRPSQAGMRVSTRHDEDTLTHAGRSKQRRGRTGPDGCVRVDACS